MSNNGSHGREPTLGEYEAFLKVFVTTSVSDERDFFFHSPMAGKTPPWSGSSAEKLIQKFCVGRKEDRYVYTEPTEGHVEEEQTYKEIELWVAGTRNLRGAFLHEMRPEKFPKKEPRPSEIDPYARPLERGTVATAFLTFPPVLSLSLGRLIEKRIMRRGRDGKIVDRFEYPVHLDMTEFLALSAPSSPSLNYRLFGVLVHQGNDQTTAFVKQGRDDSWLRYENGIVAPVSSIREVTQDNFGGTRRSKTAMHLTYIREDSIDEFFAEKDRRCCQHCGLKATTACSKCKTARYCSPEHQAVDWPDHKKVCTRITPRISALLVKLKSFGFWTLLILVYIAAFFFFFQS